MVSFSCENCGDVLTKKKLDPHRNRCHGASFTCLDCMVHFPGTSYRAHTSCISEAQKYEGALYKDKKSKQRQQTPTRAESKAVVPRNAYVEDAPDTESGPLATIDVPPPAPSPPPAAAVNVFDFLVPEDDGPKSSKAIPAPRDEPHISQESAARQPPPPPAEPTQMEHYYTGGYAPQDHYAKHGFLYGDAPVQPTFERYDSYLTLAVPQPPPPGYEESTYYTPAPKLTSHARTSKPQDQPSSSTVKRSTDKKRKRQHPEDLDLSLLRPPHPQDGGDHTMPDAPAPGLHHSGLTGGLNRLLSARPDFPPSPDYSGPDGAERSPLTPLKRSKRSSEAGKIVDRAPGRETRKQKEEEEKEQHKHRAHGRELQLVRKKAARAADGGERAVHRVRRTRHWEEAEATATGAAEREHGERDREGRHRHRQTQTQTHHWKRRSPSSSSPDRTARKQRRALAYQRAASAEPPPPPRAPGGARELIVHPDSTATATARAELFMSLVTKGPESGRGCSVNKALKRYRREVRGEGRGEEEKELWKALRMRRNERGEIVLFF